MLRCVASFFSFSTHAPLYGVTLAQAKGSVARAASTHAPAMGATESTNRIGVAGDASTHAHGVRQCIATILMMFLLALASFSPPTAPFASA